MSVRHRQQRDGGPRSQPCTAVFHAPARSTRFWSRADGQRQPSWRNYQAASAQLRPLVARRAEESLAERQVGETPKPRRILAASRDICRRSCVDSILISAGDALSYELLSDTQDSLRISPTHNRIVGSEYDL